MYDRLTRPCAQVAGENVGYLFSGGRVLLIVLVVAFEVVLLALGYHPVLALLLPLVTVAGAVLITAPTREKQTLATVRRVLAVLVAGELA